MYYPIIDKLKTLMTDIASVKEKEALVIVGTMTSTTGGTWTGNFSDIVSAFTNKRPVFFHLSTPTETILLPVISATTSNAFTCIFILGTSTARGKLNPDNTIELVVF